MLARRAALALAPVLLLAGCATADPPAPARSDAPLAGLPADTAMYVVGDSWSVGLAADPKRTAPIVAAATLGWTVRIDAVNGTGYVHVTSPTSKPFPQRIEALPEGRTQQLVLLQGSTNDLPVPEAEEAAAVERTIGLVRARFPAAKVVMLGPGPYSVGVVERVAALDRTLTRVAAAQRVPYISMVEQRWITPANIDYVIDPRTVHPSVAGDAYLGGRLAVALEALQ